MTRFIPAVLAAALCLAAVLLGISQLREFGKPPDATFIGPGDCRFAAPVAGEFTIWHESIAAIDGVYLKRDAELPDGTSITVRHGDMIIPVTVDHSTSMSSGEEVRRTSVLRFAAAVPGEYLITVSGFSARHAFAVTHGPVIMPLFAAIGCFMTAAATGVAAVVLLVLALTGTFPRKSKPPAQTFP